jgi:hypothetical protein
MKKRQKPADLMLDAGGSGKRRRAYSPAWTGLRKMHVPSLPRAVVPIDLNQAAQLPRREQYAETVIENPTDFDAIEVHDVCEFIDSDSAVIYEADCDQHETSSYSVYAHFKEGGIDCCGDFTRREEALAYGQELATEHGWPFYDHTLYPSHTEATKRHQEALLEMAFALRAGYHHALQCLDPDPASDFVVAGFIRAIYIGVLTEIWRFLEVSLD